ncbi:hypothetical protein, partial [Xenorhabdus szentirmaii]|uniref:hypothetical protein n=1 Tax=Xenorhabdus szentirmaii TaxID=290112 RepID=UPI002B417E55
AGWYRVVIFSDIGIKERLEGGGYGLRLRNRDGVIAFNSGVGVLTKPVSLDVSNRKLSDIIPTPGIAYYHERDQVITSMEITAYPTHRTC